MAPRYLNSLTKWMWLLCSSTMNVSVSFEFSQVNARFTGGDWWNLVIFLLWSFAWSEVLVMAMGWEYFYRWRVMVDRIIMALVFDLLLSFPVWTTKTNFPSVCMHIFDPLIVSSLILKGNALSFIKSRMKMEIARFSSNGELCLGRM